MGQPADTQPVSLFDDVSPAVVGVPFGDLLDADDATREAALMQTAALDASDVRLEDIMDPEELEEGRLVNGPGFVPDVAFDWDWNMTQGQKARLLSDTAFRRQASALFDEASDFASRPLPSDPAEIANQFTMSRMERHRRTPA